MTPLRACRPIRFASILAPLLFFVAAAPAWGGLAIDQTKSTNGSKAATSITSPSFSTTTPNELLLAFISTDAKSSGITVTGITGASLTWALVKRTNAQLGTAEIWRAFATTALSSVTVKASLSQSVAASITVVTFTGADTSGTNGSGAIGNTGSNNANPGAPSASLITTRNGSWVFGVGNDWDNAISRIPGANQTILHQYLATVGDTYWVQQQNAPTPASNTTVFINDTSPSTDRYNLSIVEVLPAVSASPVPDMTISKSHSGSFVQGQTGAYTIAASNNGGVATSGTVTVTDTLPSGLTAATMSGTGWSCTLSTLTCTRSDALNAGASYPAITLTVNIANNAPASVTNTATVSGGGETNTSNNTATDPTTITPFGTLIHAGGASAHPTPVNGVFSLNYTPVGTNNALVVLIGCRDSTVTAMNLTAPGWTLTSISGLVGPSAAFDFIRTYGAITPNTNPVTFTVTLTGGGTCTNGDTTIMIDEFSGNDTTGGTTTFDAHNESLDNGVIGICTGAPVTPVNNNDVIWYGCYDNVTGVTNGYTKGQDDTTGDWTEYKILSGGAGVAQNPGFTVSTCCTSFGLGGVSIKPAGGSTSGFAVTGTATPTNLANGASVVLSQSGTTIGTTSITSAGSYSFSNVANGSYTVTPSKPGVDFSPTSQPVTVNGAPATVVAFTASSQNVNGSISPASLGAGATVTLSQNGSTIATTTALSDGTYSFTTVANGAYTVTPTLSGVNFSPTSQSVTVNGSSATVAAFTATQQTWTVTGSITPATVGVNSSVALTQNGTPVATATADSNGGYTFNVANGSYTVTPTKSNVTFNPASQNVTVNGSPVTVPAFTATQNSGIALIQNNVNGNENTINTISASFPSNNTAGNFLIVTGTAARPAGTLTISDTAGNTYTPAIGPVTDSVQNVTAYIWYVPSCLGGSNTVTLTPSAPAALEIHISEWTGLATSTPVDQTSSATGNGTAISSGAANTTVNGELIFGYTFPANNASPGTGFTQISLVNGDIDEYLIQSTAGSVAATFTQATGAWFALMATFKPAGGGSGTNYSLSGTISPAASGYQVALSGTATGNTTTNSSGAYSFSGLNAGGYTVTPGGSGFTYTPSYQNVTISSGSISGINFTAQPVATGTLAIDVTVPKDTTTAANTITSPAFSTKSGNELLLALIATDSTSSNMQVNSVTGAGLTWTMVKRTNATGGTSEIWRALAPTTLSNVTVTANLSQSVVGSMTVLSFSGVDMTTPIGASGTGSASSGAPTASLTTTRNNSWVLGVGNDYDRAVGRTVPSTQTLIHQDLSPSGDTYWMQRQNSPTPTSGTLVSINDTAPTTDKYNLSIAEVLPASTGGGGGGGGTPPTVSVISPAPSGVAATLTSLAANASDSVGVAGVQFMVDGLNIGTELTSAPYYMTWDSTTVSNGAHTLAARARNTANLTSTASITINVDNSGNPATVGSWSSPVTLPTVAVNLLLLKNNKVMFYEDGASATIWDYLNNIFSSTPDTADLFCSGHAFLADGRVLVVGGYAGGNANGIANAEIFDPTTNIWTSVPKMNYARWYPTATTLSDGRIVVTAGWNKGPNDNVGIPEIYDPSSNTWTQLTAANNPFQTYPFIYLLPDGRLLHIGGSEFPTITEALDLNSNTWTTIDSRIIDGASPAMYLPNRFVKAGSASDSQGGTAPVYNTAYVLDMTVLSPAWQQVPSMVYPRSFMNMTVLPDGTVLATGGETDRNGGDISKAVYAAELWSPTTQTWTTMASMHTPREYHSTALLLPDGRVLQSGMGADFGNVTDEKSAEFYSPPYLFKGARPSISQAPTQISYNTNFFVGTPDAASITKVVLIRNGGVTHFFDQNTRYLPLTFTQASGGLTVTAPVDGRLAPPGYYMLFLVNSNGVPSVAPMVQVGP